MPGIFAAILPYLILVGLGAGGMLYLSKDKYELAESSAFIISAIIFTVLAIGVIKLVGSLSNNKNLSGNQKKQIFYIALSFTIAAPLVIYFLVYRAIAGKKSDSDFRGKSIDEMFETQEQTRKWVIALIIIAGLILMGVIKARRV